MFGLIERDLESTKRWRARERAANRVSRGPLSSSIRLDESLRGASRGGGGLVHKRREGASEARHEGVASLGVGSQGEGGTDRAGLSWRDPRRWLVGFFFSSSSSSSSSCSCLVGPPLIKHRQQQYVIALHERNPCPPRPHLNQSPRTLHCCGVIDERNGKRNDRWAERRSVKRTVQMKGWM